MERERVVAVYAYRLHQGVPGLCTYESVSIVCRVWYVFASMFVFAYCCVRAARYSFWVVFIRLPVASLWQRPRAPTHAPTHENGFANSHTPQHALSLLHVPSICGRGRAFKLTKIRLTAQLSLCWVDPGRHGVRL